MELFIQALGVGGVLVFGFVASWIFGREYFDGTAKDLLVLPTSRTKTINAKFIIYRAWCCALVISNCLVGLLICTFLQIQASDADLAMIHLTNHLSTTILTVFQGTPIAFFAIWVKDYLAPLDFVALTLVIPK